MSGGAETTRTGVGIDLLEIERLERALERRPRLAERLFTDAERAYAARRARPGQHLAARFCAKEAVAKALAMDAWSFRDVEVLGGDGPPEVRLSGSVARRAAMLGVRVSVSLTHTRREAGAIAIAA
jgi:holo-[acyl-carrier protein] synthase